MTMYLTDTSEHFLIELGGPAATARQLASLVGQANNQACMTSLTGPAGFVQIDMVGMDRAIVLAVGRHDGWNLRADATTCRITAYVEHRSLAASWAAATVLLSTLSTDPEFSTFVITAMPVNEAIAESQF